MQNDLPFKPLYDAHAIAEAVIYFQFSENFTEEEWALLNNLKEEFKSDFTQLIPINRVQLNMDKNLIANINTNNNGYELRKNDPLTGKTLWSIRVESLLISVHCLDYSRWEEVFKNIKFFYNQIFFKLSISKNTLFQIGLKNIDQFYYEGEAAIFDLKKLFNEQTIYLPQNSFLKGMIWHNYSGWFENNATLNSQLLNQLNVTLTNVDIGKKQKHITNIEHNVQMQLHEEQKKSLFENGDALIFNQMHLENKKTIHGLLSSQMNKRISLTTGDF